jgi:hypothetical protein
VAWRSPRISGFNIMARLSFALKLSDAVKHGMFLGATCYI